MLKVEWTVELKHINGSNTTIKMPALTDLRDLPESAAFSGVATYRGTINVADKTRGRWLNLGRVQGVSEVMINGKTCGVQWYGNRVFPVEGFIQNGSNTLEVRVTTTMGNYLKTLKDNLIAQFWTNEKRKDQPVASMGLIGPVTLA